MYEQLVQKAPYAAAGATTYFGLTINELGVIVGIAATVITTAYNIWHKRQLRRLLREGQTLKNRQYRGERQVREDPDGSEGEQVR
jgi:hypothetical protein